MTSGASAVNASRDAVWRSLQRRVTGYYRAPAARRLASHESARLIPRPLRAGDRRSTGHPEGHRDAARDAGRSGGAAPPPATAAARGRPGAARRARPPDPNGQWKIDGTAPLNGNEEWKQVDDGLARARAHREDLLQGRVRLDRPDRPARPLPRVGPLHAAQARASTAAAPRPSSRTSSRTSTSCCASASTAAS